MKVRSSEKKRQVSGDTLHLLRALKFSPTGGARSEASIGRPTGVSVSEKKNSSLIYRVYAKRGGKGTRLRGQPVT